MIRWCFDGGARAMRKSSLIKEIIAESDVQVAPRKSLREDTADALRELILLKTAAWHFYPRT